MPNLFKAGKTSFFRPDDRIIGKLIPALKDMQVRIFVLPEQRMRQVSNRNVSIRYYHLIRFLDSEPGKCICPQNIMTGWQ